MKYFQLKVFMATKIIRISLLKMSPQQRHTNTTLTVLWQQQTPILTYPQDY